ncbi:MAG: Zn-dependent hydrolase [Bacillota bacterium]|jgi:N-carbamoyl-L-amino-acid hydrolase
MKPSFRISEQRLLTRVRELGTIGVDAPQGLVRVAATDADKAGRDQVVAWMRGAGLEIVIDRIGNIFGIWQTAENEDEEPVMVGSHIDTVINAGIYDGCYGVISGVEVIQTLIEAGFQPARPIVVAAFTNEEGIRYQPDMMGSLVYAGGLSVEEALATVGTDGSILGEELERIGYAGEAEPGFMKPSAYVELHVEQGPVLASLEIPIGAVENLQGISWQRLTIEGVANHAGTTPISMRKDAGLAAARIITFLRALADSSGGSTVATVGTIEFEPNAINVIPSRAVLTVDLRDADEEKLRQAEKRLTEYLEELEDTAGVTIAAERLVRFAPVSFDENIVGMIEAAAEKRGLPARRMTSGAGHDAQMMARICPAAMIFVPSVAGISHNPQEYTREADLIAGANVLLDVVVALSEAWQKS